MELNKDIITSISSNLNVKERQVEVVLNLLSEGNTIPFIARYRKEATGALDEEQIRSINEVYEYQVNLLKRKEEVIRLIDEKGLLTDELKNSIMASTKLVEVEDLYRPYKEKKKTKATEAIAMGLEPLADIFMKFPEKGNINDICKPFINDKVKTVEDAITGAKYIIAERISDDAKFRKSIREYIYKNGIIVSKVKKNAEDENKVYEIYYDYKERVKDIKPHRTLAINRGEKEGVLSVGISIEDKEITDYLEKRIIKDRNSIVNNYIREAIDDSFKRLIFPSVEREIRSDLKDIAEEQAIVNFRKNLEALLMTPPMKEKVVLGYDPAYRTGCKLAVIDGTGKPLDIEVIYPTPPHNDIEKSKKIVLDLIDKYNIDIIAIGNGTASRESEKFIADTIKEAKKKVEYIIVSEAGASVYSASPLAISEFPDLTVEKRSAISIGRRLQDTLAELVKIDPKSIGVGLYQHDVTPKRLDESLTFSVEKIVNQVGVNINTASKSLLSYISGLNKKSIDALVDYRDKNGRFNTRLEVSKVKGISDKTYEQAIGFLRVIDGPNPLDKTGIHPESYAKTIELLKSINLDVSDIGTSKLVEELNKITVDEYSKKLDIDKYTLEDIIKSLKTPLRDPRDEMPKPILRQDVLTLEDLHLGDKLAGTVRNVVDFGAFVDVGLHDDGLVHISKISKDFIKHPSDVLSVGDIVDCYVIGIDLNKHKLQLSLLKEDA